MDKIYETTLPNGVVDTVWQDDGQGVLHFHSEQRCGEMLELNKALYNEAGEHPRWGDGRIVARLPETLLWELFQKGILREPKDLHKWLMDPDNRAFRVTAGSL